MKRIIGTCSFCGCDICVQTSLILFLFTCSNCGITDKYSVSEINEIDTSDAMEFYFGLS
jgi:hypothetical protein